MEMISEELVTETWMEVGSLSESEARERMEQVQKRQPNLLAFVMAATEDLGSDANELGLYLFVVILQMFEKAAGRKVKRVTQKRIDETHKTNEKFMGEMAAAGEGFLEEGAESMSSGQPFVVKYLVEALFESGEEEDAPELTEDEIGALFLVLKTVIDTLDEAE
jgi:hypothetical protein